MDETTRLNLDKMIQEYGAEETTEKIRNLKHSKLIKDDVQKFVNFRHKYVRLARTNKEQYKQMAKKHCSFLYDNYTNIFNRLLKDELNLGILANFLDVLKRIEDGDIDQHEGSYEIGLLLKKSSILDASRSLETIFTPPNILGIELSGNFPFMISQLFSMKFHTVSVCL